MTMWPSQANALPVLTGEVAAVAMASNADEAVAAGTRLIEDRSFPSVRAWTAAGGRAVACFPVYTPQEIIHALGMLPVTVHGGGESTEITKADAALGSFLCSISKSTLELGLTGRLDPFSAFIFPYICDVSRNLEGVFQRRFPQQTTHMLHLPQNFSSRSTASFLTTEYGRLTAKLERVADRKLTNDALLESIDLFNRQRELFDRLAVLRRESPWKVSLLEQYVLVRLGSLLPREAHVGLLERVLEEFRSRVRPPRDGIRVVLVGPFCEQPPLELLQLLEDAGCHVVDDQLQAQSRWHGAVSTEGDGLANLAAAYVSAPYDIGVRMTPTTKAEAILAKAREARAQGVLFLTAKFCEPALEDVVLYDRALSRNGFPTLHLEFEEKSSGYDQSRLAVETFVESVLFE